jgi:hypothetical protein
MARSKTFGVCGMRSAVWNRLILAAALSPWLTACVSSPTQRFVGVSPVLDADSVERSSGRIDRVMAALARDAGGGSYYEITEAGFNYVDDRCMEYFSELFYLNRRREAAKAGLGAFSQTSNAILAATGASGLSMAIVAQAFGLAQNVTDIAAGTYLYQLPPATTLSFVKKLQGAYREAAAARRGQINSPATAYHIIQDYLSLCLPPVIEAKLIEHVSDAAATPARSSSAANIDIDVGSAVQPSAGSSATAPLSNAHDPLPAPKKTVQDPNAVGAFERRLGGARVKKIQRSLCVVPANGVLDEATRVAVDELFRGIKEQGNTSTFPSARQGGIQAAHMKKLREAETAVGGLCDPARDVSPFEIGRLVP